MLFNDVFFTLDHFACFHRIAARPSGSYCKLGCFRKKIGWVRYRVECIHVRHLLSVQWLSETGRRFLFYIKKSRFFGHFVLFCQISRALTLHWLGGGEMPPTTCEVSPWFILKLLQISTRNLRYLIQYKFGIHTKLQQILSDFFFRKWRFIDVRWHDF